MTARQSTRPRGLFPAPRGVAGRGGRAAAGRALVRYFGPGATGDAPTGFSEKARGPLLVDEVRYERRTGANHEERVCLVNRWRSGFEKRVPNAAFVAGEPIDGSEATL